MSTTNPITRYPSEKDMKSWRRATRATTQAKPQSRNLNMLDARPPTPELKAIAELNSTASPLLHLPPEVRNTIFQYAYSGLNIYLSNTASYISGDGPKINVTHYPTLTWPSVPSPFVALQQTCRQIYTETALLPFSSVNKFCFLSVTSLDVCKPKFCSAQWDCISHVFFVVSVNTVTSDPDIFNPPPIGNFRKERLQGLSSFRGLQKVTVYLNADQGEAGALLNGLKTALEDDVKEAVPAGVEIVFALRAKVSRTPPPLPWV